MCCRALGVLLALSLAVAGCSDPAPNEARLLLDRIARLDPDDLESRRALIEALDAMPLTAEPVVEARDACVQMHAALVRAEDLSAGAQAALEAAERAGGDPGREERARIEAALTGSQAAIDEVRTLQPRCHGRLEELRARYGSGGRGGGSAL